MTGYADDTDLDAKYMAEKVKEEDKALGRAGLRMFLRPTPRYRGGQPHFAPRYVWNEFSVATMSYDVVAQLHDFTVQRAWSVGMAALSSSAVLSIE